MRGETSLLAPHVYAPCVEIEIPQAEIDQFRYPQSMAIRHQHQQMITHAVSPMSGGFQEALHLGVGEEVFPPPIDHPFGAWFEHDRDNSLHYSG